jgi:hypothetical protein
MSKRGWLAWVISLTGHALLVVCVVQLSAALPSSPDTPKADVNRVIDAPGEYCSISISFDDDPPKSAPTPIRQKADPPKKQLEQPAPKSSQIHDNQVESKVKDDPGATGLVQAGHRAPGAMPLDGKLTRPGASIVYVLDQSGSMVRDGNLKRAIAMLKASLGQLGSDVRFQVVVYDSKSTIMRINGSRELVMASESNRKQADTLLDEIIGEGSSRHVEGLITGLGLHPDILILLTDADELSRADVARCKQWNRKGTAIHAIVLGKAATGNSSLQELTGSERLHHIAASGLANPSPNRRSP